MADVEQDDDAAAADAAGFAYRPGYSTTTIFFKHEETLRQLAWRPTPIHPLIPANLDRTAISLCASSKGLVAWHHRITNHYYVGNPFVDSFSEEQQQEDDDEEEEEDDDDDDDDVGLAYGHFPLQPPPRYHHPDRTHVVLAVHRPAAAPSSIWLLICAVHQSDSIYTFDTFSSDTDAWDSLTRIDLQDGRTIVPNSGISCGRIAYWLIGGPFGMLPSVLRYDHFGKNLMKIGSFLELPPGVPLGARMQLGRVGNRPGLAVVDEDASTLELYTLQRPHSRPQDPWTRIQRFRVQLQDVDTDWGGDEGVIVCRAMPMPIRFDSFKVELPLWVQGRVVVLHNSTNDPRGSYQLLLTVHRDVPAGIVHGVPHVCTSNLPRDFLPFNY